MFSPIISVLALAAAVTAKTIPIEVGNGGIIFSPNSTTADVGDILEFHFYSQFGPHSVVEGSFDSPCKPASSPFFSSYIAGTSSGNETYSIAVTSTDPIWYYCSAREHCPFGMVGVVNPPANQTVEQFAAAAKSVSSNVGPGTTLISGTYATIPATAIASSSASGSSAVSVSSSVSATGSPSATGSVVASATSPGAASASSSSKAGGARQTAVAGLMAVGGLAALMV